jgi:hypothetical protein
MTRRWAARQIDATDVSGSAPLDEPFDHPLRAPRTAEASPP